jgi:hypothetical protein
MEGTHNIRGKMVLTKMHKECAQIWWRTKFLPAFGLGKKKKEVVHDGKENKI